MNENNIQDNPLPIASDRVLDSSSDIPVTESEQEEISEEIISEPSEESLETTLETDNSSVSESIDYSEVLMEIKAMQEESIATQTLTCKSVSDINMTLQHIDNTVEYGVCLLIIVLVIILMQYVYKFFKMFF